MQPFAGRFQYVEFDMSTSTWPAAIPVTVDSVVTSLCIHHLPDHRKQGLFAEIFEHLAAGGWYVNYDPVSCADPVVEATWARVNDQDDPEAAAKHLHRTPQEQARYENHVRYVIPPRPAAGLSAVGRLPGGRRLLETSGERDLRRTPTGLRPPPRIVEGYRSLLSRMCSGHRPPHRRAPGTAEPRVRHRSDRPWASGSCSPAWSGPRSLDLWCGRPGSGGSVRGSAASSPGVPPWSPVAWLILWVGGALLQLLPSQRGIAALHDQLGSTEGTPGWPACTTSPGLSSATPEAPRSSHWLR